MTAIAPASRDRARPVGELVVGLGLLGVFIAGTILSTVLPMAPQLAVVCTILLLVLVVPAAYQSRRGADMSIFLLAPTIISAFQNVYLLPVVGQLTGGQFQIVIVLNFVDAVVLLGVLAFVRPERRPHRSALDRLVRLVALLALVTTLYGLFSAVLFRADLTSALAAYRNLVTPMLFVLLGLVGARSTRARNYLGALCALGVVVVLFGFYELNAPSFWQNAGLTRLWDAKGIGTAASTGLPANFYSSEQFDDRPLRRMVGSFADPVNFGTFLFAAFVAAWVLRRWIVALLMLAAMALAVSKGGLLTVLVFAALWTRVYANRAVQVVAVVAVVVAGVVVYGYTLTNSTGSTEAHVGGFTAAFTELPGHPMGRGMGNVGVLASLFDDGSGSEVQESGLGVTIAQLGVVGVAVYGWFFVALVRGAARIADERLRLAALALTVGFIANAAFNEVAMSPNSASPYFVAIGLCIGAGAARSQLRDDRLTEIPHCNTFEPSNRYGNA